MKSASSRKRIRHHRTSVKPATVRKINANQSPSSVLVGQSHGIHATKRAIVKDDDELPNLIAVSASSTPPNEADDGMGEAEASAESAAPKVNKVHL